jgi:hypothetical protein
MESQLWSGGEIGCQRRELYDELRLDNTPLLHTARNSVYEMNVITVVSKLVYEKG